MALNPIRLMDWMYLYQSGEDKRPQFYLQTDNETFPEELRLRVTTIPDLNMRIRTGNLDAVFERIIDHITPIFDIGKETIGTLFYCPETVGFGFEITDEEGIRQIPVGVVIEIFLKPEEENKDDKV